MGQKLKKNVGNVGIVCNVTECSNLTFSNTSSYIKRNLKKLLFKNKNKSQMLTVGLL